ncbi:hypothetical protein GCM10027360_92130 [Amycolatopsis echigonensis]
MTSKIRPRIRLLSLRPCFDIGSAEGVPNVDGRSSPGRVADDRGGEERNLSRSVASLDDNLP